MVYQKISKRIFDFIGAGGLLLVLSPLLLLIFFILFLKNKKQVFFIQPRVGYQNRVFLICKFKTMNDQTDNDGNLLPDEKRISKTGHFLRKYSLDELPQLINILKGEMSFIGPRPLLPEYLPFYNSEQIKRHNVVPGITGLAQVNGRNAISWEEKFDWDLVYVQNCSLLLDLKIIGKTFKKVLSSGANGDILAHPFTGNMDLSSSSS